MTTTRFCCLLVLLLTLLPGCEPNQPTQAVNVLGTEESIFKGVATDELVKRTDPNQVAVSTGRLDLKLLTPQHFFVAVIDGHQLQQYFAARNIDLDGKLLEPKPESISLQDIDSLLFMLDDSMITAGMTGASSAGGWSLQINFSQPVDQSTWQRWLLGPTSTETTLEQRPAQILGNGDLAMTWLSDRQAVLATQAELTSITKRLSQPIPSQLGNRLQEQFQDQFILAGLQAEPLRQLADRLAGMSSIATAAPLGQASEQLDAAIAGLRSLESVQLQAQLEGTNLGKLELSFVDESSAKIVQTLINQGIDSLAEIRPSQGQEAFGPAGGTPAAGLSAEVQKLFEEIRSELSNGGLQSEMEGNQIVINLQRPDRFDALIDESLEGWQTAKRQLFQIRKAGEISAALQRFVEKQGRLPANAASPRLYDSEKEATDELPQFSWRVALLPELGYQELYDQFDFDQAWDSPRNLQVAARMPAVFDWQSIPESGTGEWIESEKGTPESDFHMLTGNGGAGNPDITHPDQVPDQPDKTILIQSVVNSRSPWTKPDPGWEVKDLNDYVQVQPGPQQLVPAIFYSGRVIRLTQETNAEDWFKWVTPDGSERMNRTLLQRSTIFDPIQD